VDIGRGTTCAGEVDHRPKPLGDVDTSVMAVLADGNLHGYAILAEVRELSDGRVRRYYRPTDHGRGALASELERREQLLTAARNRLAGAT